MFEDFGKSISSVIEDRLKSPIFGAFVLSWAAFNWKIVFVATSFSLITPDKIAQISSNLSWYTSILFPAISTVLFIALYPWLTVGVLWFWEAATPLKKKMKDKAEEKTPISRQEHARLRVALRESKKRYEEELKDVKDVEDSYKIVLAGKEKEMEEILGRMASKDQEISQLRSMLERQDERNKRVSPRGLTLLRILNNGNGPVPTKSLVIATMWPDSELRYELDKLSAQNMIVDNYNADTVSITSVGRAYWYEHGSEIDLNS